MGFTETFGEAGAVVFAVATDAVFTVTLVVGGEDALVTEDEGFTAVGEEVTVVTELVAFAAFLADPPAVLVLLVVAFGDVTLVAFGEAEILAVVAVVPVGAVDGGEVGVPALLMFASPFVAIAGMGWEFASLVGVVVVIVLGEVSGTPEAFDRVAREAVGETMELDEDDKAAVEAVEDA